MRHIITLLLLTGIGMGSASADVLLIDRVEQSQAHSQPARGSSMDTVRAHFGDPQAAGAAVGEPPITRWVYPEFTVYFEYDKVINTVVHRATAHELGPKPAPSN